MDVQISCVCPGQPHDSDTVTLRDRLDFRAAAAIKGDIILMKLDSPGATTGATLAVLSEGYILYGIESWTLVGPDAKGRMVPLPVTHDAIRERIIDNPDLEDAMRIADVADDLYAKSVMRPLLASASPSSRGTPMESSTSQDPSPSETTESRRTSPTSLPTPSKRSSTSTSPTASTGRTTASRAGDSSSSQNSTSAA